MTGFLCLCRAIEGSRENMEEIREWAEDPMYRDRLTGLYNYDGFLRAAQGQLDRGEGGAIAVLNIRQFKYINEMLGREKGDELLKFVAGAIVDGPKSIRVAGRAGSDVFYLYIDGTDGKQIVGEMDGFLHALTRSSIGVLGAFQMRAYCGVIVSRPKGEIPHYTLEQMLTRMMYALAKAREYSENKTWLFDAELHKEEQKEEDVILHMHAALRAKEFELYLQPKVDVSTGRLASAEALVRWHRDGRMLSPGLFIPIFDKTGFSFYLDRYMLQEVGRLIRGWRERGIAPIPVSVNQTKITFYNETYINYLKWIKETYGIPDGGMILEILESMAVDNLGEANRILDEARSLGYRISMDDFGSGYSSLNVLAKLKLDELKIDQTFLRNMGPEGKERIILQMIIDLSRRFGISTVVEGVETREQEAMVRSMGCSLGQGYLYSRPLPAKEFTERFM